MKIKSYWGILCLFFGVLSLTAEELRILPLHFAVRAGKSPTLDGSLEDPAWSQAPAFSAYRLLYGDKPQKTSLRIIYDHKGIYFGVKNYEDKTDKLKVTVRSRNGGHVWEDDSAEFYVDTTGTGAAMYKFDVNSVGAIADFWQVDMGFTDYNWSASTAVSATVKAKDFWTIEFFVGNTDLKVQPKPGDVWMFMHQRFTYTSGNRTAQSSSGGNFGNRKFGYLFFVDTGFPAADDIIARIKKTVQAPWLVEFQGQYYYYDGKEQINGDQEHLKKVFTALVWKAIGELDEASSKALKDELAATEKKYTALELLSKLHGIFTQAVDLQQKNRVNTLFN